MQERTKGENEMKTEQEITNIVREHGGKYLTVGRVPTWVSKTMLEGFELEAGKIRSFWVREGARVYGEPVSDPWQKVIQECFENPSQEQKAEQVPAQKEQAQEQKENTALMPERLTELFYEKIMKLPHSSRMMHFQNTDLRYIKHRPGRAGEEYAFVEGHYMHQVLNLVSGFTWESYIEGWKETEKEIICWGHIVVNGVSKSAVGQADIHFRKDGKGHLCLGDDYKSAHTDMEKKAASKFGIAIDVYRGEV